MNRTAPVSLICALLVFALGAGTEISSTTRADAGASMVYASTAPGDVLPILPRVVVVARAPAKDAPVAAAVSSVMFGEAVQRAGASVGHSAGAAVRKVSLAIPFYAFGEIASSPTE